MHSSCPLKPASIRQLVMRCTAFWCRKMEDSQRCGLHAWQQGGVDQMGERDAGVWAARRWIAYESLYNCCRRAAAQ